MAAVEALTTLAADNVSESQGVLLSRNDAGSFQSRFSTVRVASSSAVMLRGMHGTMFGMWIAHGEGQA